MSRGQKPIPDRRGEKFIADIFADWQAHGRSVLETLRSDKPAYYVRIAAAVLPKERNVQPDPLDELTDAELFERIVRVAARAGLDVRPVALVARARPAHDAAATRG
jgi:hypothetical protein